MKNLVILIFFPLCVLGQETGDSLKEQKKGPAPVNLNRAQNMLKVEELYLGQHVDNPEHQTVTIFFFVPSTIKEARLEVYDLDTERVLKFFTILMMGYWAIEFETRSLPSGLFGYRLLVDGQPAAHKKMVITH